MSSINLGALVQGLGVGTQQGQQMASEARKIKRMDKLEEREDAQYERSTKIQGDQDAYRAKVKDTLSAMEPGDDYGAATKINDLVIEGSLVDPDGSRSLLPMAEIHMKRHLENTAREGVKAIETGDAQTMAALNEKFPGSKNIDRNEDGSYAATFDPATDSFNFSIGGKPTVIPRGEAANMLQSMTTPEAALNNLVAQSKAQLKEVGDGLAQIKDGKITWIKPPSVKLTAVDNGGTTEMVDPSGNVVASFKKTSEPPKTVNYNGGGGGRGGRANGVQSRVQNADGTFSLIMRDGTTKLAVNAEGQPITGVTPEQLKRLDIAGKVYTGSLSDDPTADAKTAGDLPLPAPEAKRPPAAKGVLPKGLPNGAKQVGTSGGKPVYETKDGKRFIED